MATTAQQMIAAANAVVPRISGADAVALARSGNALFVDGSVRENTPTEDATEDGGGTPDG